MTVIILRDWFWLFEVAGRVFVESTSLPRETQIAHLSLRFFLDPASVFQSKLLPLSIRGSLGTSDYETDTTTAAEANFHDYLSSSQPKPFLQPQNSSRQALTRANFDALKRKSSGTSQNATNFFALHFLSTHTYRQR